MMKTFKLFIPVPFVLISLLSLFSYGGLSAQGSQGPPKFGGDFEFLAKEFHLPGGNEILNRDINLGPTTVYLDYSLLTFMSYRDGNWEIYTSNSKGENLKRLTQNDYDDITPRLNRGSNRIVFSSNRDGNYEIYTMDTNGKNLSRLTYNDFHDRFPSWSFNGQKILFDSARWGKYFIFSMNANGSNQTQLIESHGYVGQPYESPDGKSFLYPSNNQQDSIWRRNYSFPIPLLLVSKSYAQNPVWSPDGSKIAFDADGDNDGWQEVWVMDADGTNQRMVLQTPKNVDPYVRAWSPDGRYISFTWTEWIRYQGNWYWTLATPGYVDYLSGDAQVFTNSFQVEWFPDWQSTDITPPTSTVLPLPAHSKDNVTVRWEGADPGGSGVVKFDVQFRVGVAGEWQNWLEGTSANSSNFNRIAGKTVYFRSRATDRLEQVGAWSTDVNPPFTTFHNWKLSGQTIDNRLVPLAGTKVLPMSYIIENEASGEDGLFTAYFYGSESVYDISLGKLGYGSPASTEFPKSSASFLEVLLPPADNILDDPDFEAPSFNDNDWLAGGVHTPSLQSYQRHTGKQSAKLGRLVGVQAAGESRLGQKVTIPADMLYPTLSFAYQQGLNGGNEAQALRISVDDGQQMTAVFTGTESSHWTYDWVDLAPWAGEEITLTFSLQIPDGAADVWATIDETFLGSAYPDSWNTISSQTYFPSGESPTLTLQYGNKSSAATTGTVVTMTLPSGLTFVDANPAPAVQIGQELRWELGTLSSSSGPGSITISTEVSATLVIPTSLQISAVIQSDTPELNLTNNQSTTKIYIGNRILFPIITR